jgi:hypothetical protein
MMNAEPSIPVEVNVFFTSIDGKSLQAAPYRRERQRDSRPESFSISRDSLIIDRVGPAGYPHEQGASPQLQGL